MWSPKLSNIHLTPTPSSNYIHPIRTLHGFNTDREATRVAFRYDDVLLVECLHPLALPNDIPFIVMIGSLWALVHSASAVTEMALEGWGESPC